MPDVEFEAFEIHRLTCKECSHVAVYVTVDGNLDCEWVLDCRACGLKRLVDPRTGCCD